MEFDQHHSARDNGMVPPLELTDIVYTSGSPSEGRTGDQHQGSCDAGHSFHNRKHRHSSLGMLAPIEFEKMHTYPV